MAPNQIPRAYSVYKHKFVCMTMWHPQECRLLIGSHTTHHLASQWEARIARECASYATLVAYGINFQLSVFISRLHRNYSTYREILLNHIVFTIFRLNWNQTDVRLIPNQLENGKYNLIPG